MRRVQRSKLANPSAASQPTQPSKSRYNNGKKRVIGAEASSTRAIRAELSRNCDPAGTGMLPAIKDRVLSAAISASPAGPTTPTRPSRKIGDFTGVSGSKVDRNRLGRRSTALRVSEVRNILTAAVFTAEEHRPLNRHTTIHFDKCGIADPVAALRCYTKLARDWLATKGAIFSYIWVRESGDGKGEHAHLLMHVPAALIRAFAKRERGWRKRIGAKRARGAFKSTAVGRSYRHGEVGIQYGKPYNEARDGIVAYLVKGADPSAAKALQLTRLAPGGELWGKRSGMSENINRTARDRTLQK